MLSARGSGGGQGAAMRAAQAAYPRGTLLRAGTSCTYETGEIMLLEGASDTVELVPLVRKFK
ncbi:hypothetical protein GCM10010372_10860 [Streptomyces tauricus]|nr:hypothetical protein GCM10010372_10860 [Streptomyces tauricus]